MFYLLQLCKAILSKYEVGNLARMACDVNGCAKAASPHEDLPPEVQRLEISLCESHLDILSRSIQEADQEAKDLQVPLPLDLIVLTEVRGLLFPAGHPRLKLVESGDGDSDHVRGRNSWAPGGR